MRFLDCDVRRPLAAVSAINDEGNTVVFSKKWGNYIENDVTGARIPIERIGDAFEMKLKKTDAEVGSKKRVTWADDGGRRYEGMQIGAAEEPEIDDDEFFKEIEQRVRDENNGKAGFSRQMQR